MASRRDFKKDVNFLTNEIFMRSMIHLEFFGKRNSDDVYKIMNEAADARNNYVARINQKIDKKIRPKIACHRREARLFN